MEAELTRAETSSAPIAGRRLWDDLRRAVAHAVVGADEPLRLIVIAILAEGHVLLEDVPGTGKTLLANAVARALDLSFGRVQGTPDLLPTDVTGASLYEGGSLRFVPGPVFSNVVLVDEVNRATPRTQSALLEAMQERQGTVEGVTDRLADPVIELATQEPVGIEGAGAPPQAPLDPLIVLATQNPVEFEGTFARPQAQLDRFLLRAGVGYPDREAERRIARRYQAAADPLQAVDVVISPERLLEVRNGVRIVRVADEVEAYLVELVRATRTHPDLSLGGSPRATVALYRAAQAAAALDARDFVTPDDVKAVVRAVLTHRLIVDLDRSLHGATAERALDSILAPVPVPPVAGVPG